MRTTAPALIFLLAAMVNLSVFAAQAPDPAEDNSAQSPNATSGAKRSVPDDKNADAAKLPIVRLGDEYQNSITLLQNRFRVDYNVDEVTMVFFRDYGSAPVVLVRPDGSKIYQSRAEEENVKWYDDAAFDMITIKNPVPGPWQAVGQIKPDSRIMIISDVSLHAEPLPPTIFSGEILKQTAYLSNGDEPINQPEFRDVVKLEIELVSTNNPNYDNFGADNAIIATFEDNGRGMDERPLDGTFTGQFNLSVAAGEWKPVFRVVTPMYTREQVDPNLILYPNPVKLDVVMASGDENYHTLMIDVNREQVDIQSILVDGKIRYPNGDIQNFSLTEPSPAARSQRILALDEGQFRAKLTVYGKTIDGRDFILDVPPYTFQAAPPVVETAPEEMLTEMPDGNGEGDELPADAPEKETPSAPPQPEAMSNGTLVLLLVVVNGTILIVVLATVWVITRRLKQTPAARTSEHKSGSWFKRLFNRKT
ncbi:TIGR03503 family protein [Salinimonas profundi]|nr:TIGR03503 family protein [Salinimonas profundi]